MSFNDDNSINITQINDIMIKKVKDKFISYEKILNRCYRLIRQSVNKYNNYCFFQIPEFMLGYPTYNIQTCYKYIQTKLNTNGFRVSFVPPNVAYIQWNKPDDRKIIDYIDFHNCIENEKHAELEYNNNNNNNNSFANSKNNNPKTNKINSILDINPIKKI